MAAKLTDVKNYLSTPEKPVSMAEFKEFWETCTDEEKQEFKDFVDNEAQKAE